MEQLSLNRYGSLVRFFEKQVEWFGLPRNTGLVPTALYLNKYSSNAGYSIDDLCELTKYSRSNIGLILSQLEALGIVISNTDLAQSSRGRRRLMYSIDEDSGSLLSLGFKKIVDKLKGIIDSIDSIIEIYSSDDPQVVKMMTDIKQDTEGLITSISQEQF
ncbi:MAG: hypothetical protein E4H14_18370 [Candidatus Thorarchaeota archaeon]|nr:MAG: hypothetical protein E4H14_18370 [Candidatus Thorarchaeota archaeon]